MKEDRVEKNRPGWLKLDNAAKIYPAAKSRRWSNVFRISSYLKDDIDPEVLQTSLSVTLRRFPSIAVKIKNGMFWYYLEEIDAVPEVSPEGAYPCARMTDSELSACAFRVLYYKNRISFELFHALTDGNGALIFLKTLTAEYITEKYGVDITAGHGVLDRSEEPSEDELEDSFLRHSGDIAASRKESFSYKLRGTKISGDYLTVTTGIMNPAEVMAEAKKYGATVTVFLVSLMIEAISEIQAESTPKISSRKPVKVLVPVNLRNFFDSSSLRNFALYVSPGIECNTGNFTFEEIIKTVYHQMGVSLTQKQLLTRINANVKSEKSLFLKIMPLFVKNIALKIVYKTVGEKTTSVTISNLGAVKLPEEMIPYVERMDFILGILSQSAYNCSVVSYGEKMCFTFTRNIEESDLERKFFTKLVKHGIHVKLESNKNFN